ncbi:hypothetical protein MKX03_020285, partial [Papaver bracteatum]
MLIIYFYFLFLMYYIIFLKKLFGYLLGLALNHAEGERIGVTETIEKVIDEGGRGSLHVAAAGGSITPLHHATVKGHFDTVRYLLEKGANPDASDNTNATPLLYAAKLGDAKIITLLLSRGVRVDVATGHGTALKFAANLGHRDVVKVLLDHGANFWSMAVDALTPLNAALSVKSWEYMKLLLQ